MRVINNSKILSKNYNSCKNKFSYIISKNTYTNLYTNSNDKKGFDYRVFLFKDKDNIHKASFWHDLEHFNTKDNTFNMVVEIPRGEVAKLEMSKETHNPIKQDTKKGKFTKEDYLRFYKLTPSFNYGFIPRTWENNEVKTLGGYLGDNDPLDVVELTEGGRFYTGEIRHVYIIGSFCLIDQGEVDWKVLAVDKNSISLDDSKEYLRDSKNLNKVKDIQHWFKVYKTYEGKKLNEIYDNDRIFNIEETKKVIEENHKFYMDLISSKLI
jgi:inorganic pyrophosphatase